MTHKRLKEDMSTESHKSRSADATSGHPVRRACLAAIALTTFGIASVPSASADTGDTLRNAVAAVRGSACGPMRYDTTVEQAAGEINKTTNLWIDHASRTVPETDAMPLLKDLGYGGTKAIILSGAGHTDALSIKGLLLQGYAKIPDCQYTDFGVNAQYNATKDLVLTTVVLAA